MVEQFGASYMMSQGTGKFGEVVRRAHFEVVIDSFDTILTSQNCSLPKWELEKVTIPHFNTEVKIIGRPTVSDVMVSILDTVQPDILQQLWTWFKLGFDPNTKKIGYASDYKKGGKIIQYDVAGTEMRVWTCEGLFMTSSPTPSEPVDYASMEPCKIDLSMSCDSATLDG